MKAVAFYLLAASLVLAASFSFSGCESNTKVANTAPANLTLTASRCFVRTGGTIALAGTATDDDGDPLTFRWIAAAGTFTPSSGEGESVEWKAPSAPGAVTIKMTVTDEIVTVSMDQVITVCTPLPASITTDRTIENIGSFYITTGSDLLPIAATATVTIEPGVTIVFDGAASGIEAFGHIVAEGTAGSKIRFRGNSCGTSTGLWDGIYLEEASCSAVFKYVDIGASRNGVQVMNGAAITLDNCAVYDNTSRGLSVLTDASSAQVRSCQIWENGTGIEIENATVAISKSSIQYNTVNGIEMSHSFSDPVVTIDSTVIANNGEIGILLSNRSVPSIHYCTFGGNGPETGPGCAIRLAGYQGSDTIHAEHNYWGAGNTTAQKIGDVIYDGNDEFGLPYVYFIPWLPESPVALKGGVAEITKERPWAR